MRLQYTGQPRPNVVRDDRYMKHRASYHESVMTRLLRSSWRERSRIRGGKRGKNEDVYD